MFNTIEIDNRFNYNINAVSGTVRKSHPKSKFEVAVLSDTTFIFNGKTPRLTNYSEEVVVLQVMLIGDKRGLVEYVLKKDFEGGSDD